MDQSILAEFDGKVIIPAQPLPYPPGQRLRITIEAATAEGERLEDHLPPELERRDDGAVVVRGRRISLYLLVEAAKQGASPAEIHQRFPDIEQDAVVRILDFCREHDDLVNGYFDQQAALGGHVTDPLHRGPSLAELRSRIAQSKPS